MDTLASSASNSGPLIAPAQPQPKIIFVLDNVSLAANYEDDFLPSQIRLPRPLEILCDAYAPLLQLILETPLHMLGRIGAIYISFGTRGYYEIIPLPHAGNLLSPNAIRGLLGELFQTRLVVEQHLVSVAQYIASDEQSLVDRLPANSLIMGCLSGVDVGNVQRAIGDSLGAANSACTPVFVVGGFTGREIDNYIDEYVRVSGQTLTASSIVAKVCTQCMDALGIF